MADEPEDVFLREPVSVTKTSLVVEHPDYPLNPLALADWPVIFGADTQRMLVRLGEGDLAELVLAVDVHDDTIWTQHRHNHAGERGAEGTTARPWPGGTRVSFVRLVEPSERRLHIVHGEPRAEGAALRVVHDDPYAVAPLRVVHGEPYSRPSLIVTHGDPY